MTAYSYDEQALSAVNRTDIIETPFTSEQLDELRRLSTHGGVEWPLNPEQEALCARWSEEHRTQRKKFLRK